MYEIYLRIIKPSSSGHEYRASFPNTESLVIRCTYPFNRLASTVFHHFVASDNASESFAGLKRIHGLMPYFMLKAALKISNPVAMIRGKKATHCSTEL